MTSQNKRPSSTCPRCEGTGKIWDPQINVISAFLSGGWSLINDLTAEERCRRCSGKGYIGEQTAN